MDSQDFRVERLYREVSCDLKQIPFDAKGSVVTSAQRIHPTQPRLCHFFPFPILRLASQTECGISTPKLVSLHAASWIFDSKSGPVCTKTTQNRTADPALLCEFIHKDERGCRESAKAAVSDVWRITSQRPISNLGIWDKNSWRVCLLSLIRQQIRISWVAFCTLPWFLSCWMCIRNAGLIARRHAQRNYCHQQG